MKLLLLKIVFIAVFFTSCSSEQSDVLSTSSGNNEVQIKVYGSRYPMEPWKTVIVGEGYGGKDSVSTEIYADQLNSETVQFNWIDDNTVNIGFSQTDDTRRVIQFRVTPGGIAVQEQ